MQTSRLHHNRRAGRRARTALALALAAGALAAGAAPASATTATCHFEAHVAFSSPIGMTPTSGTYKSDDAGSADCHGTLGHQMAGSGGTYQMSGRFGSNYPAWGVVLEDSCAIGIGAGTMEARVPPLIGFLGEMSITTTGRETFRRVGDTIKLHGDGRADGEPVTWDGVAQLLPDSGQDCVTTPLTSARIVESVTFTDGSDSGDGATGPAADTTPTSAAGTTSTPAAGTTSTPAAGTTSTPAARRARRCRHAHGARHRGCARRARGQRRHARHNG